jgi:hypothetical protein
MVSSLTKININGPRARWNFTIQNYPEQSPAVSIYSVFMELSPFLKSPQLRSYLRTSLNFMEPESSLPLSQESSTGPYPEPDQSSPYKGKAIPVTDRGGP